MLRRMGPRLRGDDRGESLLHIFPRGDDAGVLVTFVATPHFLWVPALASLGRDDKPFGTG
jgi:hypothetical protein